MKRAIPIFALALIVVGIAGLVVVGCQTQPLAPFGNPQGYGFPDEMMGGGGMMGPGMMGNGYAPNVNATPVPSNQSIDREVKITARNLQFDPTRVVVKQGETVRFAFTNQDSYAHNFGSADARIPFILLPANGMASTVWVAAQKGTYNALCTLHPGMQLLIVVE